METSNTLSDVSCPDPHEVETVRYPYLSDQKGYPHTGALLDDIAPMVARGQIRSLPVCHPSLYTQVAEITEDWTFDELHSCASHRVRQCPIPLRELRIQLDQAEYEAIRYVLLKLACERPFDSPSRRVLQAVGGGSEELTQLFQQSAEVMNPADVFDFENFEPFWFISPELSDLFNIKESSEVSRSSRGLSQTHGHYLIRREATEEDHETISRIYTYLYRPASFEEKARDLSNSFGWDANKLAQESDYSAYEIQQILDKPDEEIEPLNPFDTTQHKGEVNFAAVETYLRDKFEDFSLETTDLAETTSHQVTATHIPYPTYPYPSYTDRSEPQYVDQTPVEPATYYYPNPQTEADPVMPSELVLRVEAILSYASEVGRKVEVSTLVAATNSTIKDVLTALSEVDPGLLERTI